MTAQDIILGALKLVGAISPGENPTYDEMQDSLNALNMMLESWSEDSLLQPGTQLENFTLTAGTASYQIGTGKTFNTAKPIEIQDAFVRNSSNYDFPVDIKTSEEYYGIPDIGVSSATGLPKILYYDPGTAQQATPFGTIYLYPAPDSATAYTLYIKSLKYFTEFVSLTDTFTFQAAYERAMKYSLAIEIAPLFGAAISPEVALVQEKAMKTITNSNSKQFISRVDIGKKPSGNIYTFK